jgi:hypothetical protein
MLQQEPTLLEYAKYLGPREKCVIEVKLIKTYIKRTARDGLRRKSFLRVRNS